LNIPPELLVFFSSMLPITELRGAIPLGFLYGLPAEATFIYAIVGNILPVFLILWLLDPISKFLSRHIAFFKNFFDNLYKRTHDKHLDSIEKYGPIFLIIFVAIPLPGSGAWTGSLIAFLFGIKYWKALLYIFIGLLLSGTIMTLASMGVINLF
jgi:uncharacterized membrane protein